MAKLEMVMVAALMLAGAVTFCNAAETAGRFEGQLVVEFLPGGRNVKLERSFAFVDQSGRTWDVPAGTETDGASVPKAFWITHPPFTGKYRAAAVIHDYYCQTKSRDWRDTHRVFYQAMLAADVPEREAKGLFAAVYHFGPRWNLGEDGRRRLVERLSGEQQKSLIQQLQTWIDRENPDLEAIINRASERIPMLRR